MSIETFNLSELARAELAPQAVLRAAIAVGPAASALWCTRDPETGRARGVTVDIATAVAERLGIALELVEFSSSGEIVSQADAAKWTISFVPVDDERRMLLEVGSFYYLGVSTYLTRAGKFHTVADVDKNGVRVAGVAGTATFRSAERSLRNTSITAFNVLDEAVQLFRKGQIDAIALGKESIVSLVGQIPDTHAVQGHFHEAGTGVVAPKGHKEGLAAAARVLEVLKKDGTMRRIFDQNGMSHAEVAP